jgi:hypothetical protein
MVLLVLPTVLCKVLSEVSLLIEKAYSKEWDVKVARTL